MEVHRRVVASPELQLSDSTGQIVVSNEVLKQLLLQVLLRGIAGLDEGTLPVPERLFWIKIAVN